VQSSPFEMVEMERIVSGKRGSVTRGLMEYGRWAIAINVSHQIHQQNFKIVN